MLGLPSEVLSDAVYLLGRSNADFPFIENEENLVLAKFDLNLNLLWSKVFYSNDGSLTLGYSTFGYFPTILARLDAKAKSSGKKVIPFFNLNWTSCLTAHC